MESWAIDHPIIEGNPQSDEFWADVEAHIIRRYVQAWHGGTLGIDAISLDANYQTQAVLNFVRRMQARGLKVYAVRGDGDPKKPIKGPGTSQDVTWRGQKWPNGTKLWTVGVKQAKDLLHGQLSIEQPGPGFVHTSDQLPREWYEQLTAEQRVLVSTVRGPEERWIKRRPRNEVLDTRNYAVHAAHMLGLPKFTDARWVQIRAAVQPPRDLFSGPATAVAEPSTPASDMPEDRPAPTRERSLPPSPPPPLSRPVGLGRSW
jgi:phage terminase large subunit GpA-like protein